MYSFAGPMTNLSSFPSVLCDPGINWRMLSISSPKSSIRTGCGSDGGQISRMPPRRANCPGVVTVPVDW